MGRDDGSDDDDNHIDDQIVVEVLDDKQNVPNQIVVVLDDQHNVNGNQIVVVLDDQQNINGGNQVNVDRRSFFRSIYLLIIGVEGVRILLRELSAENMEFR